MAVMATPVHRREQTFALTYDEKEGPGLTFLLVGFNEGNLRKGTKREIEAHDEVTNKENRGCSARPGVPFT